MEMSTYVLIFLLICPSFLCIVARQTTGRKIAVYLCYLVDKVNLNFYIWNNKVYMVDEGNLRKSENNIDSSW